MRFLIALILISFFLINCDDTSSSHSSASTSRIMGNWEPGEYRVITYDSNQVTIQDTTYSSYYDLFTGFDMEFEMILAVASTYMEYHMLEDGKYTKDQIGYSLSGDNLTFNDQSLMEDDFSELLFYKAKIEGERLLLHSKSAMNDSLDAGYKYVEAYMYFNKYTGEIPPSNWPSLTEAPDEDSYEIDNTYNAATTINPNGQSQAHSMHSLYDVDWLKFSAESGKTYTIKSTGNIDVYAYLYDNDGSTMLDENDDGDLDLNFEIIWDCTSTGIYYIEIAGYETGNYSVSVSESRDVVSRINNLDNTKRVKKSKFVLPGIILK